jgi:hypothetical protein
MGLGERGNAGRLVKRDLIYSKRGLIYRQKRPTKGDIEMGWVSDATQVGLSKET